MVDLDKLGSSTCCATREVEGCHCQGDADIFAYECAHLDESLAENKKALKLYIESQRIMAGAEHMNLHLTLGKKAGRYERAQVKEYQANRKNRDPQLVERVRALREFMAQYVTDTCTPYPWYDREADDGMAQMQIARINALGKDKSIIMTADKDLRMVPGLHVHPNTHDFNEAPNGYGMCYLDENTSTKKVLGWGRSFFWHQMLMGDSADNIPGLPRICNSIVDEVNPLKSGKPRAAGSMACGPVMAYRVLEGCRSDMEALRRVLSAYQKTYTKGTIVNWKGDTVAYTANDAFFEQAHLLWMQRVENEPFTAFLEELSGSN